VPSAFVLLDAMPLTPNGKIDRKALPEAQVTTAASPVYEEPRGELEAELARVWAAVLGVDRVGAYDSFFDVGGHSLLMVEAQRRVREELGREVSVMEMFQFPTVSALAQR